VLCVFRAGGDPLAEELLFMVGEFEVGVRRRHPRHFVVARDPRDQLAFIWLTGRDRDLDGAVA
jgi:hypothetical protein